MPRDWDTNSCFLIILFYFIVISAVGVLGSFLTSLLGFPYTWIGGLELLIMGSLFILIYRRYSMLSWLLVACLAIILISGVAILRGLTATKPSLPPQIEAFLQSSDDPSWLDILSNDPGDFAQFNAFDTTLEADRSYFILYGDIYNNYDPRTTFTIQFPAFPTTEGQWAFKSGEVRASGAINGNLTVDPGLNWINADEVTFRDSEITSVAIPYLVVSLPINSAYQDKPITLRAQLTLTYPEKEGAELQIKEETLTREVNVLVASNAYYSYKSAYDGWRNSRRIIETPIWIGLIVLSVLAGGGALALVRMGALTYQGGALRFEIRRLSGSEKLGIEAHPLAKMGMSSEGGGVFIGFVNAQSPAGRSGLRSGDILLTFAGKPIKSPNEVYRLASRLKKGEAVQASLLRDNEPVELVIKF